MRYRNMQKKLRAMSGHLHEQSEDAPEAAQNTASALPSSL
jgi:hypothetical protein